MKFIKYPKIINSAKDIQYLKNKLGETIIENQEYIITEKIHGANFSIYYDNHTNEVKLGKRTSFLEHDDNFYGFQGYFTKEKIKEILNAFNKVFTLFDKNEVDYFIIYGEFFGPGIQKEIDYGEYKQFLAFDVAYVKDDKFNLVTQNTLYNNVDNKYLVPKIDIVPSFSDTMNVPFDFETKINSYDGNICEGIVIKPYNTVLHYKGKLLYIKRKNNKFKEKAKVPKQNKLDLNNFSEIINFAKSCVNVNRLNSLESKYGKLEEMSQIGNYIKWFNEDVAEDIASEFEKWNEITKKEKKAILKTINKDIVDLLKQRIEGVL